MRRIDIQFLQAGNNGKTKLAGVTLIKENGLTLGIKGNNKNTNNSSIG